MSAAICGSAKARVTAVGWPCATSAAKLGPESAPMGRESGVSGVGEPGPGASAETLRDHLGHAQETPVLQALGGADQQLAGTQVRADAQQGGAQKLGRNDGDHDLGRRDGVVAGGDGEIGGQRKSGKELRIFAGAGDLPRQLVGVGPERDLVAAAAAEREREGGSPSAGTEYGDAAHVIFLAPKRDSVPAIRRRMFW